ncbi:squamosa promoter-binding-like protein 16 [Sesamum indicum]|uniref:Squamosa promoter-binding-like protein 16 n=1 Tax=Sesamum indicum TaxID=4182 RepID=A0A6I9U018_SESIN|nr:squamosa promoter-binding-like protein 16 [Sesamum indicum]
MEPSSFTGSSKRAKAPGNITQVANCLVDGCNADLSLCRDYHRRHKVCETHSKTPKVTIGGREQRFCQQCSRVSGFREIYDNRRRRKPQPDSISRSSGLVFSNQQGLSGTRLLSFTSPQILPSAVVGSSWPVVVKAENEMLMYSNQQQQQHLNYAERRNSFPDQCSAHSYKVVNNQLQFMQGSDRAVQEASICQPLLDPNAASGSSNCSSHKIFSDGLNQVVDSDRALSLLSSAQPITREFGLNQTDSLPQAQSLVHNLHYSGLGQYPFIQESKPVVSATDDSHGSNASTVNFPEMFQQGPEGSSTCGSHQTLTFMWE